MDVPGHANDGGNTREARSVDRFRVYEHPASPSDTPKAIHSCNISGNMQQFGNLPYKIRQHSGNFPSKIRQHSCNFPSQVWQHSGNIPGQVCQCSNKHPGNRQHSVNPSRASWQPSHNPVTTPHSTLIRGDIAQQIAATGAVRGVVCPLSVRADNVGSTTSALAWGALH